MSDSESKTVFGCIVALLVTLALALAIWVGGVSWPVVGLISAGYLFAGMLIDPADFRGLLDKLPSFGKKNEP